MQMKAGEFKSKCLKLMDEVQRRHMEVVITKRGKPVAKLVPIDASPARTLRGFLKGSVTIKGDIVAGTGEVWDAESK